MVRQLPLLPGINERPREARFYFPALRSLVDSLNPAAMQVSDKTIRADSLDSTVRQHGVTPDCHSEEENGHRVSGGGRVSLAQARLGPSL